MATIIFKHITNIEFKDYDVTAGITDFTGNIQTFVGATDTGLALFEGEDNTIRATFTGDFTTHPDWPFDMYGILEIDSRNLGGVEFIKQISTIFDSNNFVQANDQVWIGSVATNKASLTILATPDRVVIEAELDESKIDFNVNEYKLTARLGRVPVLESFCILQEDNAKILQEDAVSCIEQEN